MATPGMVGIDTSKDSLAVATVVAGTLKKKWEGSVRNSAQGIKELLCKTPREYPWVIEPTGRYSILAVKMGIAAGRQVLLAPPRKAKAFLKSLQDRAKTDRLDAHGLALFGLSREVSKPLQAYPVKKESMDKVDQILSARKGLSKARSSLKLQARELPHARAVLQESIKALDEQIEALDKQIATLMKEEPELVSARELDRVPGIGPVTATAFTARLAAKQFRKPEEFVAYFGMDIGIIESGKRKGERGLTHEGDEELRRLAYLAAQASLRAKNSPFKTQYERELAKGMSKTAAICAVARKIIRLSWSLYTHKTSYDPARVYSQPKAEPRPAPATPATGE